MMAQMWPWGEIEALADRMYTELKERTREVMREAGEDPDNEKLFRVRCGQVAYGISSRADKEVTK